MPDALEERARRLEAIEEIRQLASKYAAAVDRRDVDALVALYVPDIPTGDGRHGRDALAEWFRPVLAGFGMSFHLTAQHAIDFVDEDHATGVVYCRPEHDVEDLWIVMPMQYWDRYERRDGHWYFRSRKALAFYAADVGEHPLRVPGRFHFPGNEVITKAELPERWPTWQAFVGGAG